MRLEMINPVSDFESELGDIQNAKPIVESRVKNKSYSVFVDFLG